MEKELNYQKPSVRLSVRLITGVLFALPLLYLPYYGSFAALRYFVFALAALILALVTSHIWLTHRSIPKDLFKHPLAYGPLVYLIGFLIVSITSTDPGVSFFSTFQRTDGFFSVLFLTLFSYSVFTVIKLCGQKIVKSFLSASVAGAVVLSLLIMLSSDGLGLMLANSRGGATLGNSSLAGAYVLWNMACAVLLLIRSAALKERLIWISGLGIMLLSPLFIGWKTIFGTVSATGIASYIGAARGAFVALIFGSVIAAAIWLSLRSAKSTRRIGRTLLVLLLLLPLVTSFFLFTENSKIRTQFIEHTTESRLIFWGSALKGIEKHPLLGRGPGTYGDTYHEFFNKDILKPENPPEVLADRTHNIIFEHAAGGGALLLICLGIILASLCLALIKISKKDPVLATVFSGAAVAWFFQAQFVFESLATLVMLYLVFAILLATLDTKDGGETGVPSVKAVWVQSAFVVGLIVLAIYAVFLPHEKARVMTKVYESSLPERGSMWSDLSGISPMGDQYDSALLFNYIFVAYADQADEIRAANPRDKGVVLNELDNISLYLDELIAKRPNNFELVFTAARLKYLRIYISGNFKSKELITAIELTNRAAALSPEDPRPGVIQKQLKRLASKSLIPESAD